VPTLYHRVPHGWRQIGDLLERDSGSGWGHRNRHVDLLPADAPALGVLDRIREGPHHS
jgi:hypothetical protein